MRLRHPQGDPGSTSRPPCGWRNRSADSVNDNRQYLPIGQIQRPQVTLDTFAEPGVHYGNWVWWEYLSSRFGNGIVRDVWSRLDANKGLPNMYSTEGLRAVLKSRGGFTTLFAAYAGANTVPAKSYAEGDKWPSAFISGGDVLGKSDRRAAFGASVDHMASRNYVVKPDRSLRGKWRLRITVDGPNRASAPRPTSSSAASTVPWSVTPSSSPARA